MSSVPTQPRKPFRPWPVPTTFGGLIVSALIALGMFSKAELFLINPSDEQRACTFGRYLSHTKETKPKNVQVFVREGNTRRPIEGIEGFACPIKGERIREMGGGTASEDALFGVVRRTTPTFEFPDERVMLVGKGGDVGQLERVPGTAHCNNIVRRGPAGVGIYTHSGTAALRDRGQLDPGDYEIELVPAYQCVELSARTTK